MYLLGKNLTSLSIAGIRSKMNYLDTLDLSCMMFGQSAFEWIGEGCKALRVRH
jgi:hypothetical protein